MTITVQIGNTDDKLPQARWSDFWLEVDTEIRLRANPIYFTGASFPADRWQNAAWVFDINEHNAFMLRRILSRICASFGQDSIAWTSGSTEFIGPCASK